MPVERTKRGAERTPLGGAYDVLICGASFAGLAVARELAGTRRACADDRSLRDRRAADLGVRDADRVDERAGGRGRAAADVLGARDPHAAHDRALRAAVDVLDVRLPRLCARCWTSRTRPVRDGQGGRARTGFTRPHRPRRPVRAADRRRARAGGGCSAPATRSAAGRAALARARGASAAGRGDELEIWIDRRYVPAGYGWSFPARDELRIGRRLVRPALPREGHDRGAGRRSRPPGGALPGQLDPAPVPRRRRRTACSSPATRPGTACR